MIVAAVRQSRAEPVVRHHFPHSGDVQGSCGPWCALIEASRDQGRQPQQLRIGMVHPSRLAPAFVFLSGVDASFATGQRFNAFHLSEAMRSATA